MSELSMPTTAKKTQFSTTYLPLFLFLSSFLISNLISFLPYLLNLLHFISPLLITTLLVFLFTSLNTLIENPADARSNNAGEREQEQHEIYKIFFEAASQFELQSSEESQQPVDKFLICVSDETEDRNSSPEKTLEELFQEKEQSCETVNCLQVVLSENEVKANNTDSKNVVGVSKEELETDITEYVEREDEYEEISMKSVGSYGSMRVDKEWKRTLACKLFEERHTNNGNAGDEEGMDLLWEAYEENSSSAEHTKAEKKKKLEKKCSVGSTMSSTYKGMEDDDEDEDLAGKICCLQALQFSSGKVNLGMGRPNMGRISKAFRGIGWLHHVRKGFSPLKPKVLLSN